MQPIEVPTTHREFGQKSSGAELSGAPAGRILTLGRWGRS
jgi:hypothetical protein